ncbi:MAG: ComF family protein [Bacteroidetes bacterium]|nr:MAG: ComF family protein [Bacteroidota bacterium]
MCGAAANFLLPFGQQTEAFMPFVRQHLEALANFLMPNTCPACGDGLGTSKIPLCWRCLQQLPLTQFEGMQDNPVNRMFFGRLPLEYASAMLFFNAGALAQQLVHQIKYKGNQELGIYMGQLMGQAMQNTAWGNSIDVVVPLPLNAKKLKKRGYNQSMLLCQGIAQILQKPIENVAVVRKVYTQTQTRKTRMQRWSNVAEVFDLKTADILVNKHVLLVDDVVTTGATLDACGQKLVQIPGLRLSVNCLAFASKI